MGSPYMHIRVRNFSEFLIWLITKADCQFFLAIQYYVEVNIQPIYVVQIHKVNG